MYLIKKFLATSMAFTIYSSLGAVPAFALTIAFPLPTLFGGIIFDNGPAFPSFVPGDSDPVE